MNLKPTGKGRFVWTLRKEDKEVSVKVVVTTSLVILVLLAIPCTQVGDRAVDGGLTVS